MSIIDKITGRAKQAAGDVADDPSLRRQGQREEAKGNAKEQLARAEDHADAAPDAWPTSSARPERRTDGPGDGCGMLAGASAPAALCGP